MNIFKALLNGYSTVVWFVIAMAVGTPARANDFEVAQLSSEIFKDPELVKLGQNLDYQSDQFLQRVNPSSYNPNDLRTRISKDIGRCVPKRWTHPYAMSGYKSAMNPFGEMALEALKGEAVADKLINARNAYFNRLRDLIAKAAADPRKLPIIGRMASGGVLRGLGALAAIGLVSSARAAAQDVAVIGDYVVNNAANGEPGGAVVNLMQEGYGIVTGVGGLYTSAAAAAGALGASLPALPAVPALFPGLATSWGAGASTALGGVGWGGAAGAFSGTLAGAAVSGIATTSLVVAVAAGGYGAGYALGQVDLGKGYTVGDWLVDNSAINDLMGGSTTASRERELAELATEMKDNVENFKRNTGDCRSLVKEEASACEVNRSRIAQAAQDGTCDQLKTSAQQMACNSLRNVACGANESRIRAKEKVFGEDVVEAIQGSCRPAPAPSSAPDAAPDMEPVNPFGDQWQGCPTH